MGIVWRRSILFAAGRVSHSINPHCFIFSLWLLGFLSAVLSFQAVLLTDPLVDSALSGATSDALKWGIWLCLFYLISATIGGVAALMVSALCWY